MGKTRKNSTELFPMRLFIVFIAGLQVDGNRSNSSRDSANETHMRDKILCMDFAVECDIIYDEKSGWGLRGEER